MDERRHEQMRTRWEWDSSLRDAYREAVTQILDHKALVVAVAPVAARPVPALLRRLTRS